MQTNNQKTLAKFTAVLLISAKASAALYAGDLCCSFYKGPNYSGDSMALCYDIDSHGEDGQMTFKMSDYANWDDNIESWWCGKNLKYDFCDLEEGECGGYLG